jgi:uncharacterized membrane protein
MKMLWRVNLAKKLYEKFIGGVLKIFVVASSSFLIEVYSSRECK